MKYARGDHRIIQLDDGKILVVGGQDGVQALRSCEIYDPLIDAWSETDSLHIPRYRFGIAKLGNGNILVVGGLTDVNIATTSTAEVYDVNTKHWTQISSMKNRREGFPLVSLPDNKFLCVGGLDGDAHQTLPTCELFDGNTLQFQSFPSLLYPTWNGNANYLSSQKAIVVTGAAGGANTYLMRSTQIFHFSDNKWSLGDSMVISQGDYINHVVLPNDNIIALGGGTTFSGGTTDLVQQFDATTSTWKQVGSIDSKRKAHLSFLADSDSVLLVGGAINTPREPVAFCSWYNLTTNTCRATSPLLEARYYHRGIIISDSTTGCDIHKTLFVFGGSNAKRWLNSCEALDLGLHSVPQILTPGAIDLGTVECFQTDTTIYIKNNGCDSLLVSTATLIDSTNSFSVNITPNTIAVQDSIPVKLHFRPTLEGNKSATLQLQLRSGDQTVVRDLHIEGVSMVTHRRIRLLFKPPQSGFYGDTIVVPLYVVTDTSEELTDPSFSFTYNTDYLSMMDPIKEGTLIEHLSTVIVRENDRNATILIPGTIKLSSSKPLLLLRFKSFVTDTNKTTLSLQSLENNNEEDPICYSLYEKDSVTIHLNERCGDKAIRTFMSVIPLQITISQLSASTLKIQLNNDEPGKLEVIDMLGNVQLVILVNENNSNLTLPHHLPNGGYIVRFGSAHNTGSQKIVVR